MKIIVTKDNIEGGTKAFEIIKKGMEDGDKVLGLATGSSPIPLYDDMCDSNLDFSDMTSINLDEYYGLNPDNDQSYHYFMQKHLFDKKPFKHSYIPNGMAKDIDEEKINFAYWTWSFWKAYRYEIKRTRTRNYGS